MLYSNIVVGGASDCAGVASEELPLVGYVCCDVVGAVGACRL